MTTPRILIVAGETSGDLLAADLIRQLRQQRPDLIIEGIAGPAMRAAGCEAIIPQENLNVMGLIEVLAKLPQILRIRHQLLAHVKQHRPHLFIGVDYPEFNFSLEKKLRAQGVRTVHYISPSLWAWRSGRIKRIVRATDLMLTALPFEAKLYQAAHIPVCYVGHSMADSIPLETDQVAARQQLNLPINAQIVALLPGSRASELKYLAALFIQTAQLIQQQQPNIIFIAPMVDAARREQFTTTLQQLTPHLTIHIIDGQSQTAMAAADVVLLASGTATLEAMLLKKPMVVAYRMSAITYFFAKQLVKIPYIALPNILAGRKIVPEFIQDAAQPTALADTLLTSLNQPQDQLQTVYRKLHQQLRCNASQRAATEILNLCKGLDQT